MKSRFFALFALMLGMSLLLVSLQLRADDTANTAVGIAQGGSELFVKAGGQIKVRSNSLFAGDAHIANIGGENGNTIMAPFAGSVSSVVCINEDTHDATAVISTYINGVAITNGSVAILSTSTAYTKFTATPTALNTVAANDAVRIASDGGGSDTTAAACRVYFTP